jgi:hypothetical protein
MNRIRFRLVVVIVAMIAAAGCTVPLGPWGGPAYELNVGDIGTGKQAITPRNDADFVGGAEINMKRK